MFKLEGNARAALMGILFAMVGFSYALATSAGVSDASANASSRAVIGGTSLHFTNPKAADGSGDYDLGDAVAGSIFTTRYCRAAGGVPPYSFSSPSAATNPLSKVRPELTLLTNGQLFVAGSNGAPNGALSNAAGPIKFAVQVVDALSGSADVANGQFRITLVSTNLFKFGISSLGSAASGHTYQDSLVVVNGSVTSAKGITFSADTISGPNGTTLEANGLTVSASGAISGKPVGPGAITFTAHAVDALGNKALSRDGTHEGQVLTVNVENGSISSDIVSTSIKVGANTIGGKDKITYSGFVNLQGQAVSSLSGRNLVLQIAGYTSPAAQFSTNGKAINAVSTPGTLGRSVAKLPTVKASISSSGKLTITVSNETLATLVPSAGGLLGVGVSIVGTTGNALVSTEILQFNAKSSSRGFSLTYKLGDLKSGNTTPAGTFLMSAVTGKDASHGGTADSWRVTFIATPPAKSTLQTGTVTVSVGQLTLSNTLILSKGKGKASRGSALAGITLSDKGRGSLTTGALPSFVTGASTPSTGIPTGASNTSTNGEFPFSVDISLSQGTSGTFPTDLAGAVAIFSKRNGWTNKNPSK